MGEIQESYEEMRGDIEETQKGVEGVSGDVEGSLISLKK